uniref:Peptidase S1 domain-containing protein n=1 Tax=Romanomermis culicivorax TaxID=13658 RepID=A0A915I4W5_ROMCU
MDIGPEIQHRINLEIRLTQRTIPPRDQAVNQKFTGDSGSPLFCYKDGRYVAQGVISDGDRMIGESRVLSTKLSHYLTWILDTINDNSNTASLPWEFFLCPCMPSDRRLSCSISGLEGFDNFEDRRVGSLGSPNLSLCGDGNSSTVGG